MLLLALFAGLAVTITATGIGGVIAFTVSQRTSEIGLRMALGAQQGMVLGMILRQGLTLVLIGLTIGLAGALALGGLMAGLLFGIEPTDPWTFIGVAVVLAGVAVIACLLPARRATAISPMTALRVN